MYRESGLPPAEPNSMMRATARAEFKPLHPQPRTGSMRWASEGGYQRRARSARLGILPHRVAGT